VEIIDFCRSPLDRRRPDDYIGVRGEWIMKDTDDFYQTIIAASLSSMAVAMWVIVFRLNDILDVLSK
jgi:hypothetical protein